MFTGTGQYKQEYKIELNPDVTPTVQPARHVPYVEYEKLKDTLEQLEKRGILAKVDKPTYWVSNLIITEKKDGRMRICLDPKPLNRAVQSSERDIQCRHQVMCRDN